MDLIEAYQMVIPQEGKRDLSRILKEEKIDLVTFASSATVENFVKMAGPLRKQLKRIPVACIGPVTAKTAREKGLKVVIVPKKSTIPDLVKAITQDLRSHQTHT